MASISSMIPSVFGSSLIVCNCSVGGEQHTEYAYELLDAAYAALGRDVLREMLRVHRANRDLPSVDILDNEG
jgi:hypothetical protein